MKGKGYERRQMKFLLIRKFAASLTHVIDVKILQSCLILLLKWHANWQIPSYTCRALACLALQDFPKKNVVFQALNVVDVIMPDMC